jgi:hypothetical protein
MLLLVVVVEEEEEEEETTRDTLEMLSFTIFIDAIYR